MAQRGGKREGAGRPKGAVSDATLKMQAYKAKFLEKYELHQEELDDDLFDLALQPWDRENGTVKIAAHKEIRDRALGKAIQSVQVGELESFTKEEMEAAAKRVDKIMKKLGK